MTQHISKYEPGRILRFEAHWLETLKDCARRNARSGPRVEFVAEDAGTTPRTFHAIAVPLSEPSLQRQRCRGSRRLNLALSEAVSNQLDDITVALDCGATKAICEAIAQLHLAIC